MDSGALSKYIGCWDPQFYGGPEVQAFEKEWAAKFGVKHAVAMNSATSGLIAAVGAELLLAIVAPKPPATLPQMLPYREFTKQYLHPFYFFFFPRDEAQIAAINNSVVSIDGRGFRGALPEDRGDKKLAFIIGGSTAFGHGASSNDTTISGYLNKQQDEYLFVNAGVPSFVSSQEFTRVATELLDYRPDLIIALDGFNDAVTAHGFAVHNLPYPPGTNESYEGLAQRFDNIREQKLVTINKSRLSKYLFFRVRQKIKKLFSGSSDNGQVVAELPPSMQSQASDAAKAYLENLALIKDLSEKRGAGFVAFFQPARITDYPQRKEFLNFFRSKAGEHKAAEMKLVDLSWLSDREDIFLDSVHLTDEGSRIIAQEIMKNLAD